MSTRDKPNPPPKLVSTRVVYEQDMDCCGDTKDAQYITMETFDGGGGIYVVISTERWAADPADMAWLRERVQEMCDGED